MAKKHLLRFLKTILEKRCDPQLYGWMPHDGSRQRTSTCEAEFCSTEPMGNVTIGNACKNGEYEMVEKRHGVAIRAHYKNKDVVYCRVK